MKKKVLVYMPSGLNTPESEILLCNAQKEILKKKQVEILICRGGKNYYCSNNIYSSRLICIACKKKTQKYLSELNGNFKIIKTPKIYKLSDLPKKKFTLDNIVSYKYKKCDNGLGAYSSYTNITKDRDIEGYFGQKILNKLINCSNNLTNFFFKFLKDKNYEKIIMFNGRMNDYRPLLRVGNILKTKVENLEFNGNRNQVLNFENKLPIDQEFVAKKINKFWKRKKKKKFHLIKKFINIWINHQNLIYKDLFKINQKKNTLPATWNKQMRNIVYFASSPDETYTGGKSYFFRVFKDQTNSIDYIYRKLKNFDNFKHTKFWVRMHPRMTGNRWEYLNSLYLLRKKYSDFNLITPNSEISSYEMLKNSSLVLTPVSTLSVDAVYFNKPVINFQKNIFSNLGGSYLPKNKKDLNKLLFNKNLKTKSKLAQKKLHLFWLDGGKKYKELKGNFNTYGYTYKGKKIELNYLYKMIYKIGKIYQLIILNKINFVLRKF